jgi:hypothetical protein
MAGTRKPRWASITCACGREAMLELQRTFDVARRLKCSRCGRRGPKVLFLKGPPRVRPSWLKPRRSPGKFPEHANASASANRASTHDLTEVLDDRLDDLCPTKERPTK